MKRNSGLIGVKKVNKIDSSGGINDLFDQYIDKLRGEWPYSKEVTVGSYITSINETTSSTVSINVTTRGFAGGSLLYFTTSGTITAGDMAVGSGDFVLSGDESNATGSFDIVVAADGVVDGTDTFQFQIREGSTSGSILFTSNTITISDTSTLPPTGENLRSNFWSVAEFQNNDGASDTSSNYSVSEVQQDYSGSGRLYLAHKCTHPTSYFNDVPIACIQVLNSTGTSIVQQWHFGGSGQNQGWETHTLEYNHGAIGTGLSISPATAATYAYQAIVNGATGDRFGLASSTGSSATGAVGGILLPSSPMTLGEKTMPQSANLYYMYRETSGSRVPYTSYCRSPSRTWGAGEIIRIAYIIGNSATAGSYTPTDTLFFGIA